MHLTKAEIAAKAGIIKKCKQKSLAVGQGMTPPRECKALAANLHTISESGQFEGYACLFGKEDLGRDIVAKGAFTKSLQKRGLKGVKMLYQHDPAQPIGHWLEIREDHKGLFVRGQLMTDLEKARDVLAMMKKGILDGLSIGFRTVQGHRQGKGEAKEGCRHLLEVDLWEISVVTFPMQPQARIASVKSEAFSKRNLERKLMQDAGLSRSQARALLAHGYPGLCGKQDAVSEVRAMTDVIRQATRTLRHER